MSWIAVVNLIGGAVIGFFAGYYFIVASIMQRRNAELEKELMLIDKWFKAVSSIEDEVPVEE